MSRIVFYYQTLDGLDELLKQEDLNHVSIHLSSIHFGYEQDGQPYIHLNNTYPDADKFKTVWSQLDQAVSLGANIVLMIGGAGGGYNALFKDYQLFYILLSTILSSHPCISGIDLDIEEPVYLDNVQMLIRDIKRDFPSYTISMAPVQSSLQQDMPGMGEFIYKDLYRSDEGKLIDYFNVQFYSDFSVDAFNQIIKNGYPPNMIVMGSLNGSGSLDVIDTVNRQNSKFGGVFSWEYYDTQPSPLKWYLSVKSILNISMLKRLYLRFVSSLTRYHG